MRATSLCRLTLLASCLAGLTACADATAPIATATAVRDGYAAHNRAPGSITVIPGQGVIKDGERNDGTPPPEVRVNGALVNFPLPRP